MRLRANADPLSPRRFGTDRPLWEGQVLAVSAVAATLAVELALAPQLQHAGYLLAALIVLVCGALRGPLAALSATVLLAIGGFLVDGQTDAPLIERFVRTALFLMIGFFVTWRGLRSNLDAAVQPPPAPPPQPPNPEAFHAQLTRAWSQNTMGEMASVLAHELNQPLSAVTNYLRAARTLIAKQELEDDDLLDAVARAGDQAVRAGEIVRTMRDLASRGGTHLAPVGLSTVIHEIEFILGLISRDADVQVIYDLYEGPDTVLADRTQLQQLIINLARNAIEAVTKYPDRRVRISTRLDPDRNLLTTVEDSGPGLDPEISGRLFEPLASTKPDGMGLGLSISSAIVHNHRGRIWAEPSRLGGAAFRFVLARIGEDGRDAGVRADRVRGG